MSSKSSSRHQCNFTPSQISISLRDWYSSEVGAQLLSRIRLVLDDILPNLFGFHAMQIGNPAPELDLMASSQIHHRFCMDVLETGVAVSASSEFMPFDEDSLDLVMLMNTLEFTHDPHQILREIDRVLIPEGHLLIIGFNPFSLYGVRRLIWPRRQAVPWCGHFYHVNRLKDWLSLLGFEILGCEYRGYTPPIQRPGLQDRLAFMEPLIGKMLPFAGGVFVLLAQNKVARIRPIKTRWTPKAGLMPGKIPEPTARRPHDG